jgi:hypothetical protein
LEDRAQAVEDVPREGCEFRSAVIDDVPGERREDAVGHVGGARNLKEVPAGTHHDPASLHPAPQFPAST